MSRQKVALLAEDNSALPRTTGSARGDLSAFPGSAACPLAGGLSSNF